MLLVAGRHWQQGSLVLQAWLWSCTSTRPGTSNSSTSSTRGSAILVHGDGNDVGVL